MKNSKYALNFKSAAARLNVEVAIVRRAKNHSCPAFKSNGRIDVKILREWIALNLNLCLPTPGELAARRVSIARADRLEYELRARSSQFLHVDDISAMVTRAYLGSKNRCEAIPGKLAKQIAASTDAHEIEKLLRAEIVAAFTELSKTNWCR